MMKRRSRNKNGQRISLKLFLKIIITIIPKIKSFLSPETYQEAYVLRKKNEITKAYYLSNKNIERVKSN